MEDADSFVVGEVIDVDLGYHEMQTIVGTLFGTRKQHIWVESTVAPGFIGEAMFSNHKKRNYTDTSWRGAHFQRLADENAHDQCDLEAGATPYEYSVTRKLGPSQRNSDRNSW